MDIDRVHILHHLHPCIDSTRVNVVEQLLPCANGPKFHDSFGFIFDRIYTTTVTVAFPDFGLFISAGEIGIIASDTAAFDSVVFGRSSQAVKLIIKPCPCPGHLRDLHISCGLWLTIRFDAAIAILENILGNHGAMKSTRYEGSMMRKGRAL